MLKKEMNDEEGKGDRNLRGLKKKGTGCELLNSCNHYGPAFYEICCRSENCNKKLTPRNEVHQMCSYL